MVKSKLISLFFSSIILAGCSGVEIKAEYPNQTRLSSATKVISKTRTEARKDSFHDEHEGQRSEDYPWPMANAPILLEKTQEGQITDTKDSEGNPAIFAVLAEYSSAGNKRCKKYFVNLDLHLACYNPHWYPVRSFE